MTIQIISRIKKCKQVIKTYNNHHLKYANNFLKAAVTAKTCDINIDDCTKMVKTHVFKICSKNVTNPNSASMYKHSKAATSPNR